MAAARSRRCGGRDAVDGGTEDGPVQGVVGAQFPGHAQAGGDGGDPAVEARQLVGEFDEAAADVDAVQRALEEGAQLVLEREQRAGLRQRGGRGAVRQPLGLFGEAGAVEVTEVAAEGVRAGQPALVVAQSVGVEAQQQVPGDVRAVGEAAVGEGVLGQPQHGWRRRPVRWRAGRRRRGPGGCRGRRSAATGGARAGDADAAQTRVTGVAGGEGGGPRAEFVDGRITQEGRQVTPPRSDAVVHRKYRSCGKYRGAMSRDEYGECTVPLQSVTTAGAASTPSRVNDRHERFSWRRAGR